jgi:spore coat protein U-like protein
MIAVAIAAVAVTYYMLSGRGSYDLNVRELSGSTQVSEVDAADPKKITVKCKNGENYQITFSEAQQNYTDLIFNLCGEDGEETKE